MNSKPQDLRSRTKALALRVIRMYGKLPRRYETTVIGGQVLRSGTSVGAHYREASRGRSTAEFVSKIEGGLQELDETGYWLELLAESGLVAASRLASLQQEVEELISIFVTCAKNAKRGQRSR